MYFIVHGYAICNLKSKKLSLTTEKNDDIIKSEIVFKGLLLVTQAKPMTLSYSFAFFMLHERW